MTQHSYDHPRLAITTDICIFTVVDDDMRILLVCRGLEPFKGFWALPGGFLREDETLDQCAVRELQEETGVTGAHLEAFATFSELSRDPRYRVVTAAYLALVPASHHALKSGTDAEWHSMQRLPDLAFDHQNIIAVARWALMSKLDRETLALALLPPRFTQASAIARIFREQQKK